MLKYGGELMIFILSGWSSMQIIINTKKLKIGEIMGVSKRLSLKWYSIKEALYRNKDYVKAIIMLLAGYSYFTGFDLKTFGIAVGTAAVALVGKLLMDAFDFYFSEVKLQ